MFVSSRDEILALVAAANGCLMIKTDDLDLQRVREDLELFAMVQGLAPEVDAVGSSDTPPGQTPKTTSRASLEVYLRKGLFLLNEFVRSIDDRGVYMGHMWPETLPCPLAWVEWLVSVKAPFVTRSSWRVYRRSAVQVLREWPEEDRDLKEALARLENTAPGDFKGVSAPTFYSEARANSPQSNTSARRLRFLSPADLAVILSACIDISSRKLERGLRYLEGDSRNAALADWVVAGLATGFRPCEWRQSRLHFAAFEGQEGSPIVAFWTKAAAALEAGDGDLLALWRELKGSESSLCNIQDVGKLTVLVFNAKHSNESGNLATRAIEITNAPPPILLSISRMAIRGRHHLSQMVWNRFQRTCVAALGIINSEEFEDRNTQINLYTLRHQALANFNAGNGVFGTSVLAGHGDGKTSQRYYSTGEKSWGALWSDAIGYLLNGNMAEFWAAMEVSDYKIDAAGRRRRRSKSGKGGMRPVSHDTVLKIANIIRALALMKAPEPNAAERVKLEIRMRSSGRVGFDKHAVADRKIDAPSVRRAASNPTLNFS